MFQECRHIMPTGRKCKSPAVGGEFFCFNHFKMTHHSQDGLSNRKEPLILPPLEDFAGIQIALMQVVNALGSGRITNKQAGLYLYSFQIASTLAARAERLIPVKDPVRSLTCDNWGHYIAEEVNVCEPPNDCLNCNQRNTCDSFEKYEEEVEELQQQLAQQQNEEHEEEQERAPESAEDEKENKQDEEEQQRVEEKKLNEETAADESILTALQACTESLRQPSCNGPRVQACRKCTLKNSGPAPALSRRKPHASSRRNTAP